MVTTGRATIRKHIAAGYVVTYARGLHLEVPYLTFDHMGNLYALYYHSINRYDATGVVSQIYRPLGPSFDSISSIAFDSNGRLFVSIYNLGFIVG